VKKWSGVYLRVLLRVLARQRSFGYEPIERRGNTMLSILRSLRQTARNRIVSGATW
jgi:hypothetical protein